MCENAYLSIKNPKASRALKRALDPGRRMLASLRRQLSASEAGAPPLPKSWIRTCVLCILLKKQVKSSVVQFNIVNTPVTHFTINKNNKYSAISDVLHGCWLSGK